MISVINKHHVFYIGRGSPLGNPYSHLDNSKAEFKVNSRKEAIEKYRVWLDIQIKIKNKAVCDALNAIYKDSLHYNIYLECFCKGFHNTCHGDIIQDVILSMAKYYGKIELICQDKDNK